jgi:molybdopterin synthase catalytic subunit
MNFGFTHDPLDTAEEASGTFGAEIRFLGIVRSTEGTETISGIEYSAYLPMAEQKLDEIRNAPTPPNTKLLRLVHRLGVVPVGEPSVVIVIATKHSAEALALAQSVLHRLKTEVPIWKKFIEA